MKAKYFKKLRAQVRKYDVECTIHLFGFDGWHYFGNDFIDPICVVAKGPRQACERAKRRGYGIDKSIGSPTTRNFAHWRVKESGKSTHFKNVFYF